MKMFDLQPILYKIEVCIVLIIAIDDSKCLHFCIELTVYISNSFERIRTNKTYIVSGLFAGVYHTLITSCAKNTFYKKPVICTNFQSFFSLKHIGIVRLSSLAIIIIYHVRFIAHYCTQLCL